MTETTCLILLAAGRSDRFGWENKLVATFIGQPLISHAAKLRPGFSQSQRLAVVGKYNSPLDDV